MAKIELLGCTPMYELRGFSRAFFDDKKNPYTTDKLTDDEFNFISGMNYAVNKCLAGFIDDMDDLDELDDSVKMLRNLKKEVAKVALFSVQGAINYEISQFITEFIDSHED